MNHNDACTIGPFSKSQLQVTHFIAVRTGTERLHSSSTCPPQWRQFIRTVTCAIADASSNSPGLTLTVSFKMFKRCCDWKRLGNTVLWQAFCFSFLCSAVISATVATEMSPAGCFIWLFILLLLGRRGVLTLQSKYLFSPIISLTLCPLVILTRFCNDRNHVPADTLRGRSSNRNDFSAS